MRAVPRTGRYLIPGRLEDVLLLLQFLAHTERGFVLNSTIHRETGTGPASEGATSWAAVTQEHPEFFRVTPGEAENKAVTLLVRAGGTKVDQERLTRELLGSLVGIALQLHERQIRAAERRDRYLPLVVGLVTGVFTLVATLLPRLLLP
jgi:hypothetical protein